MSTSQIVVKYLVAVGVFFAVDLLWLGVIAKKLYGKFIGDLLRDVPNWPAAIVFYLLFLVGLMIFAIIPASQAGSLQKAALYGALYGFFTYMTYELTNYAVLKDWPWQIVIIDITWGVALATTVSCVTYIITR